ncbi:hypothetical protein LIU39_17650 [Streptomyces sp. SF28]|nr:hypothetical protein [Streptomyces pinistramenti]
MDRTEQPGLLRHLHIPLNPGLKTAPDLHERAAHRLLGLLPELIEPGVEAGDELLFLSYFLG